LGSNTLTVGGASNLVLSGAINDTGGVTKTGTGVVTLSGSAANNFSGALNIDAGTVVLSKSGGASATGGGAVNIGDGVGAANTATLQLNAADQVPDYTSLLTINSDGRLALNGFAETLDKIAGTGEIDFGAAGYLGVGVNSGSSTFGGSLAGTGTLAKLGSGTLTFNSDITNSGVSLALSGGTLQLSDADLTLGTLNVTSDSIIDFAGTASTLNLTDLAIAAGVTLTILNWQSAVDFFASTNWTGAVYDVTGNSPMNQIVFSGFSGNNTAWASNTNEIRPFVPESSIYGRLLLLMLIVIVVGYRKLLSIRT
jgi:autotransporter-associated beta strand protein